MRADIVSCKYITVVINRSGLANAGNCQFVGRRAARLTSGLRVVSLTGRSSVASRGAAAACASYPFETLRAKSRVRGTSLCCNPSGRKLLLHLQDSSISRSRTQVKQPQADLHMFNVQNMTCSGIFLHAEVKPAQAQVYPHAKSRKATEWAGLTLGDFFQRCNQHVHGNTHQGAVA